MKIPVSKISKLRNKQLIFALFVLIVAPNSLVQAAPPKPETCASYIVAEANSGEIIDSLESDQARPPASMAKLMSAYVILKKIKEGSLSLDDSVTITAEASKIGGSQVYLKQGENFTIKELLNALLVQSANDAALSLAIHASGSREGFVEEMNQAASTLGMTQAVFNSPHGLPPAKDQSADLVSPNDMLVLARALIREFPEILEITKMQVLPFRNGAFEMRNHNGLLRSFEGTDGLKTGYYSEAGFCVTTTAERKGIRLIAVLMGCPSHKIRDQIASTMLAKAFGQYKSIPIIKAGDVIVPAAPVSAGIKADVALIAKDPIVLSARVATLNPTGNLPNGIEKRLKPCSNLEAPITKGSSCGAIEFTRNEKVIGKSELLVAENIAEAGFVKKILGKIGL